MPKHRKVTKNKSGNDLTPKTNPANAFQAAAPRRMPWIASKEPAAFPRFTPGRLP